jgi:hypothetical protein
MGLWVGAGHGKGPQKKNRKKTADVRACFIWAGIVLDVQLRFFKIDF